MNVVALLMAGGRASRMQSATEKPLLMLCGTTMLERVVRALKQSRSVSRIVAAVTDWTPLTAWKARELGLEVLETPGDGYVEDMRFAIKNLGLREVLVVSADIPFLTGEVVDQVVTRYRSSGKPALAVVVPLEACDRMGLRPEYIFEHQGRQVVPAGLNVIDGTKIDMPELEQEMLVVNSETIALNVNSPQDLELARLYCRE